MKNILIAVIVSILLLLLASAFIPKHFDIATSSIITQPKDEVFNYLKLMKNANKWQAKLALSKETKQKLTGIDGTIGSTLLWKQNDGQNLVQQKIIHIIEGQKINFKFYFEKPIKITSETYFITETVEENETKVTWGIKGEVPYPLNIICHFMRKKVVTNLSRDLVNLQNTLDKTL